MSVRKKCAFCKREAEFYVPYARMSFCKEHFIEFYEKRIVKTLKSKKFKGGKILVAVSGGKDSVALLSALYNRADELNIKVAAFHINLGIDEYSKQSEEVVRKLESLFDIEFIYIDVKDELGFTIPEAVRLIKRPACAICSIVKRWIMNKIAYENHFDYIATGHNMDDASTYYLKSLVTNAVDDFIRGADVITESNAEFKLVARIRPQIFLTERDNLYYVLAKGLPFVDIQCSLAKGALILKYKTIWESILSVNPIGQLNFLKASIRIKNYIPTEKPQLFHCEKCGYATTSRDRICSFCRLKIRLREKVRIS